MNADDFAYLINVELKELLNSQLRELRKALMREEIRRQSNNDHAHTTNRGAY